ncbi:hypothetical protein IPZ70_17655 [Streptomyces polychromogenes]|nr:hypothetical protein [Streptomyces polychromogenes]
MTTPSLPHCSPGHGGGQPDTEDAEPIPWGAFSVGSDVSAVYGQPSPALIVRAKRGWRKLSFLHAHSGEDGTT